MTRLVDRNDRTTRLPADFDAPLVVHSHLRWDFVWQRPQQLLSRFAASSPVLFVEEPVWADDIATPSLELSSPMKGVTRAIPRLPGALRGDGDASIVATRTLLLQAMARGGALAGQFRAPVQWFYTPMPAPAMLGAFGERAVVYDCMDELSQFRFAPPELVERERLLIGRADVVFTGGYRLWQSKSKLHPNAHFFGCGVDSAHFAKARLSETPRPADFPAGDAPVLGYYGVIDERIDYELVRVLAERLPDYQVVMVGPVVKVDPRELPQAPNLHWLGQKQYAELPAYAKHFDVALMPFALNEATEYINPTKTLEYMAAGKPIVSTAVADVVRNFTPIVKVARSHDGFVAAARAALACPEPELVARGIGMAKDASWESIVGTMQGLIATAMGEAEQAPPAAARRASSAREVAVGGEELTA
ncbi:glycosyltransferase [Roseisolibacter sp. H3M3-2]|uniref:glycosyltransferase n=1 Tax=Roseisolibacter sp. H3M3-2 TaxID=3031323 RepID=UPI0023DB0DA6|nr:glycosyltransferase [Roseisolibacter sp. H3M3-2]MDF1502620.1 glycosyltransferase [Roseisolibacter sp. H3M3-2]